MLKTNFKKSAAISWQEQVNCFEKQKILSDTRTGILGSIAGPCDVLPARFQNFKKSVTEKLLRWHACQFYIYACV
jgi:hypothetical protein